MLDDSTKRYLLDVVDNLNIIPNKKAELYEYLRKYTIKHKRPFKPGLLGNSKASDQDTQNDLI